MNASQCIRKVRRIVRKYRRLFLLLLALLGAICAVFYFKAFFSTGMDWNGSLLIRSKENAVAVYSGRDSFGNVKITVNQKNANEFDIAYELPYNKLISYHITIENEKNFWRQVKIIDQSGTILLTGKYQKGNNFLYDQNGLPAYSGSEVILNGQNPYTPFEPNYRRMVGMVLGEYDHLRGEPWKMIVGFLLLGVVILDIRLPILSLRIRSFLFGEEQPTIAFELLQLGIRTVLIIVSLGFLLKAI